MTAGGRLTAWADRRRLPLGFTLDGRWYEIAARPAEVWVLAVLSPDPEDLLLDVLEPDVAADLWDAAEDPDCDVTPALLYRIGQTMLGRAADRPWWQVTQLVATLAHDWHILNGRAADRGLTDPLSWDIERLCDWVYLRIVDGVEPKERQRIDALLDAPPPSSDFDDPDAPPPGWDDEASGFLAMAGALGGGTVRA